MSELITISPTVRLEAGGIYVVEAAMMPAAAINNLRAILNDEEPRLGVKFLLLPAGAHVATVQVIADDIDNAV